jgi:acyl-CoA thioesterase
MRAPVRPAKRASAAGSAWLRAQFVAQDLADGRMIEDGALWDSTGRLVAQSRQLALVRLPDSV